MSPKKFKMPTEIEEKFKVAAFNYATEGMAKHYLPSYGESPEEFTERSKRKEHYEAGLLYGYAEALKLAEQILLSTLERIEQMEDAPFVAAEAINLWELKTTGEE